MPSSTKPCNGTPIATSVQSAKIDRLATKDYHLTPEILMESAGALSAQKILRHIKKKKPYKKQRHYKAGHPIKTVVVFCGPGHNGGDGLVVARHLLSEGVSVIVFLPDTKSSSLYELQKKRLQAMGNSIEKRKLLKINSLKNKTALKKHLKEDTLIVDALFGVGLSRPLTGVYKQVIQEINASKNYVVSLDTPSGLNVDTGEVWGCAVQAKLTLSFGVAKPGFYLSQGPVLTGRVKTFSIGFPHKLLKEVADTCFLIDSLWVCARWPIRLPQDHKARQGHLLVLAGSKGYSGAGYLTALSAYRMGVGYVTWAGNNITSYQKNVPEALTQTLSDPDLFKKKTAVAIGPGLGTGEHTKKLLISLKKTKLPVIVDADAWTVCVEKNLFPLPPHWVVTPHSGELARLFKIKGRDIDKDRTHYAMKASRQVGCPVLLKGFYSVLAKDKQCWIIPTGNSALAKAGTGDVLTGFIAALTARSSSAFDSAGMGSFVHGLLAEYATKKIKTKDTLMAQDLKDILPIVLKKYKLF